MAAVPEVLSTDDWECSQQCRLAPLRYVQLPTISQAAVSHISDSKPKLMVLVDICIAAFAFSEGVS